MDWLQWTASLVGSLAWPSVVIVLLILIRKQLAGLVARIEELTLPGGASAKFGKALAENREQVEAARLAENVPEAAFRPDQARERDWVLTEQFPEAAVMESFKSIEKMIVENKGKLPVIKGSLFSYVKELGNRGLLSKDMVELFKSLRNLRNIAAHGRAPDRITPGEALEYQEQCLVFAQVLKKALEKIP